MPKDSPLSTGYVDTAGHTEVGTHVVIALGVILLVTGLLTGISGLWTIGVIMTVVGAVFWVMGSVDRAVTGRRHSR
ncbi:hypothetical protein [Streptomyces sp. NBC_01361]|uniref:hypothetical protein n=1 Tax=Streptomyces sp. NBC_01361 TaxID=2903838 RepID=UPI002E2EAB16|nr:hypothetical protein [Streptomyces sp. NBC_01361]